MKKHQILRLLGGLPHFGAQDLDQLERHLRLLPQQWHEIPSLDDEQFAIRDRDCVRTSRSAVEQSELPEYVAFAEDVEYRVMAADRCGGYFHGSLADREQAGAGIALGENAGRARNRFSDDAGGQSVDMLQAELAEKIMIFQHRALVGIAKGGRNVLGAGHAPDYSRYACGINGLDRTAASCLRFGRPAAKPGRT
jgi:hypothetical protein